MENLPDYNDIWNPAQDGIYEVELARTCLVTSKTVHMNNRTKVKQLVKLMNEHGYPCELFISPVEADRRQCVYNVKFGFDNPGKYSNFQFFDEEGNGRTMSSYVGKMVDLLAFMFVSLTGVAPRLVPGKAKRTPKVKKTKYATIGEVIASFNAGVINFKQAAAYKANITRKANQEG